MCTVTWLYVFIPVNSMQGNASFLLLSVDTYE